jgi:hypothetical protein
MASANVRPYSAYSRNHLFGSAPVALNQSDQQKVRSVRIYGSSYWGPNTGTWGTVTAQTVWFRLDELDPTGDSYYYIEYRNHQEGYFVDPLATGAACAMTPGIQVRFRPGMMIPPNDAATRETYVAANFCADYAIATPGNPKTYDANSEFTITVTAMNNDYADVVLTWD